MTEWVVRQLTLLRAQWPALEHIETGHWVRIPDWKLPSGWSPSVVDVAFQIKDAADQPPYAFCVNTADLTYDKSVPGNWNPTAQVGFPGTWSQFSWSPETWTPTVNPELGPNMITFVRSFDLRFEEGA